MSPTKTPPIKISPADTSSTPTLVLDSFLVRTVDIAGVDPKQLHALSIGVRWPHRVPDWRTLLEAGRGIAAIDEIGRTVGSAMWFPYSDGFATIGMVITSPRLQAHGAGRWLMDQILAAAGPRAFGLNATREAHRLYQSLGFVDEATLYQRQGRVLPPEEAALPPGSTLRAAEPADLDALVRLDARAFGAPRPALLAHLLAAGAGTVLLRAGRIEAYALSRPFGRGQVVGTLVAMCDADAIAVGRPHVAAQAGRFLRMDTRRTDGPFAAFLARSGLAVFDTLTTMSLGRSWPAPEPDGPVTYALASQALN